MVDAIATSEKYIEFEAKHNRHLNMLAENVSRLIHSLNSSIITGP